MKKVILFSLICLLIQATVYTQGNNPCGKSWSEWRTGWNFSYGRVLFRLEFPSKSCGCGYNFVQMQHNIPNRARITMRLQGVGCDGKTFAENFSKEISGGEISSKGNEYHFFKSMPTVVNVEIEFEDGKNRIKLVGDNTGSKTYINGMTEQAYKEQQQQQQKAGTAVSNTGSTSSGTPTKSTSSTTRNTSSNTAKSPSNTTKKPAPDPAAAQRNSYKKTAMDDLQRSDQGGQSPIAQQMHLSNAMLMAQASGDVATIRQVQQIQGQATARNQQQLKESITGLTGSIVNLNSAIQDKKAREQASDQRAMELDRLRRENEALKFAEVEAATAPIKQGLLTELKKGMDEASNEYGASITDADKLLNALSWLWKFRESELLLNTKIEVRTPDYSPNVVDVISPGYVNDVMQESLLPASRLNEVLGLAELDEIGIVAVKAPKFCYPMELPRKAENKPWKFYEVFGHEVAPEEYIDRRYFGLKYSSFQNCENIYKNGRPDAKDLGYVIEHQLRWVYKYTKNYCLDSITCARDGGETSRYYEGKSSSSIYTAGYSPQKKLESYLLAGALQIDSAIITKLADVLPRAITIYQEAFDWYFSGPVRWLKLETQPAALIREGMWRYALAVAATRKNMPPSSSVEDPHAQLTKAFIKHFEQYCQLPVSRVMTPMKLKD